MIISSNRNLPLAFAEARSNDEYVIGGKFCLGVGLAKKQSAVAKFVHMVIGLGLPRYILGCVVAIHPIFMSNSKANRSWAMKRFANYVMDI